MFSVSSGSGLSSLNVGNNNIESAKKNLALLGIRLVAEDVGLNYGRTIEFFAEDGSLIIKAIGKAIKTI